MQRRASYWLLLLATMAAPGITRGAGTVTITDAPAIITPGQWVPVNVQFTKTSNEAEKRVIFRVDLHKAYTHERVAGWYADNNKAGYTGLAGSAVCNVGVPANVSGQYYFKAVMSPWSLNRAIVSHYRSYPTNGTFTYAWDSSYGVTQNVYYMGSLICPKPTANTCYCSGLAFEAAIIPFNAYNTTYGHARIGNIASAANMRTFRTIWYGVTDSEKLAARAIPEWGAGREITDFEEAQEGDFVQLWRMSGSGHNPVFVNWVRGSSGDITGVRYWGTQTSSNGIGYNTESFGTTGSRMNRSRFYIGRLAKPRDQADYDWAIAQSDTSSAPSFVYSTIPEWTNF